MFQNIVNATEPMETEKDKIEHISNNAIRKEIIMWVGMLFFPTSQGFTTLEAVVHIVAVLGFLHNMN